jgi:hypothetical protein
MQHFNKKVAIHRRTAGVLSPSGEPLETWPEVSGEGNRSINIEPLSVGAQAALRRADPGLVKMSSHQVFCQRDTDIAVDDFLLDADSNYYIVQSVEAYPTHYKILVAITGMST